jgi:hypothetical protein
MAAMTDHDDTPDTVHDVLAAEEFGMGEADPGLHQESPRDVLAADEFGVGAADPSLHHGPITVPAEPGAGPRAHDVLAADEFPVPAGPVTADRNERTITVGPRGLAGLLGAAALLIAVRRRRSG